METFIVWKIIQHFVPQQYMSLLLIILAAFVGLEQWLAATKHIKANSTLQMIVNLCQGILAKAKVQDGQGTSGPDTVQGAGTSPGQPAGGIGSSVSELGSGNPESQSAAGDSSGAGSGGESGRGTELSAQDQEALLRSQYKGYK